MSEVTTNRSGSFDYSNIKHARCHPHLRCGRNFQREIGAVIWIPKLALAEREHCVRSMFGLFQNLYVSEPLESSGSMWWDFFC
jgi:hypothetical protein